MSANSLLEAPSFRVGRPQFTRVEEFRGNGKDKEFKISLLDEEYWLPVSKIRD